MENETNDPVPAKDVTSGGVPVQIQDVAPAPAIAEEANAEPQTDAAADNHQSDAQTDDTAAVQLASEHKPAPTAKGPVVAVVVAITLFAVLTISAWMVYQRS